MAFQATFWGTRGSIPAPGPSTARYGGNTPCVHLTPIGPSGEPHDHRGVILDAGTGVRALGRELVARQQDDVLELDLLVSHTHWDHIQGLPFFAPMFEAGNEIRIWGAKPLQADLETILRNQMRPEVFPVPLERLSANLSFTHIDSGNREIGGFHVQTMTLRHPGPTLGFVLRAGSTGAGFGYIADNELSGGNYDLPASWRDEFVRFLSGIDVLVHDAMFTATELPRYSGWGHSSNVEAVALAAEADVKTLVLFHHSPERADREVDIMVEEAAEAALALGSDVQVIAAHEGLELRP